MISSWDLMKKLRELDMEHFMRNLVNAAADLRRNFLAVDEDRVKRHVLLGDGGTHPSSLGIVRELPRRRCNGNTMPFQRFHRLKLLRLAVPAVRVRDQQGGPVVHSAAARSRRRRRRAATWFKISTSAEKPIAA